MPITAVVRSRGIIGHAREGNHGCFALLAMKLSSYSTQRQRSVSSSTDPSARASRDAGSSAGVDSAVQADEVLIALQQRPEAMPLIGGSCG
jgi:hypothetical protein